MEQDDKLSLIHISGQKRNARELSMVTVLIDYLFTGACHAPVRSKQRESW